MREFARITFLACMVILSGLGVVLYRNHTATQRELEEHKQKTVALEQFISKLSGERRKADIMVVEQFEKEGKDFATLLFVEYDHNGQPLSPKRFTIEGNRAHIDAMVVKFDRHFIQEGDPLRGHSIVLFHRLFGDKQAPEQAFMIDEPGKVPEVYKSADHRVAEFEQELWSNFWRLTTDEQYRQEKGVRVANPESPWGPFEPDRLYTITLEADGGLNITSEPLKGIYREALKQHRVPATAPSGT